MDFEGGKNHTLLRKKVISQTVWRHIRYTVVASDQFSLTNIHTYA